MNIPEETVIVLKEVLAYINLAIIIFGTCGNILTCYVCSRKRLRETNTFRLLAFLAISDTLGLYEWNVDQISWFIFDKDWNGIYIWYCKLNSYFQYVFFETSAWLLVFIALDRFLSLKVSKWSKFYFKGTRVTIFGILVFVFFFLFNLRYPLNNGYIYTDENGTNHVICYFNAPNDADFVNSWANVLIAMYTVIPFALLILQNILLIWLVFKSSRGAQSSSSSSSTTSSSRKQMRMSITIIVISLLFITFTLPTASIQGATFKVLNSTHFGEFVIYLCNTFTFLYQSSNFIILYLSNSQFSKEVRVVLRNDVELSRTTQIQTSKGNTNI